MRILLVATFFPPQHAVASLRTHSFAATWSRLGHEVTVLTTAKREDQRGLDREVAGLDVVEVPYVGPRAVEWLRRHRGSGPTLAATDHGAAGRREGERDAHRRPVAGAPTGPRSAGATPDLVPAAAPPPDPDPDSATGPASGPGGGRLAPVLERLRSRYGIYAARRMPDLSDGWVRPAIEWAAGQPGWDLCVSSSGPYTPHLVARALRTSGQVQRWIADFRDLWVDNHLGGGLWPFTVRERSLQRACLEACDMAVTVSDGMAEILRRSEGIGNTPVHVVHNGYDPAELESLDAAPVLPPPSAGSASVGGTEVGGPEDGRVVRLVYTGSVHPHGQDASALFEAIAHLHREAGPGDPRFEVVIAGTPTEPWRAWAERAGVPQCVRTLGVRPREEALRLQRDADALLSIAWDGPRAGGLSGKIFEYLAGEAPVLVIGGDGDAPIVRLVTACGRGRHAGSGAREIVATLRHLGAGATVAGPADRARIETFTRGGQARRLLDLAGEHLFGRGGRGPGAGDRDRRTAGRRRAEDEAATGTTPAPAVAPAARVVHRPA